MSEVEGYKEVYSLTDLKLYFGFVMSIIGLTVSLYSFKVPFNDSKQLVAIGASIYFIVQLFLYASLTYFFIPTMYRGSKSTSSPTLKDIWIQTHLRLPEANFEIAIVDNPSKSLNFPNIGKVKTSLNASWPVNEIIREDGMIDPEEFCRLMDEFLSIHSSLEKKD